MVEHHIRRAVAADAEALGEVLLDVVAGGASVGFRPDLTRERALAFCRGALDSAARGERVIVVACDPVTGAVDGTVSVVLAMPDNQSHRADIAKMQVHSRARRRGLGRRLLGAAEAEAIAAGRRLLVLDTATGSDAERLYAALGWQRVGTIPDYAVWPDGSPCSTTYFYKRLTSG